jgi:hypothetical protein
MIEVFTICYNEEVLMPYFLRHYLSFCNHVTIYDNMSTDRSVELCDGNSKVTTIPFKSDDSLRDDMHKNIKNNCWKGSKADWVIVCDFDEFVYNFDGKVAKDYTIISPEWWEMISDHLPTTKGQIYEEINQGIPKGRPAKCLMFRPKFIKEINYAVGAHSLDAKGQVRMLNTNKILTLHYKMLSLKYYLDRTTLLRTRLSEMNKKKGWGFHYNFSEDSIIQYYQDSWRDKKQIPI